MSPFSQTSLPANIGRETHHYPHQETIIVNHIAIFISPSLCLLLAQLLHTELHRPALVLHLVNPHDPVALLVHVFAKAYHYVLGPRLFLDVLSQEGCVLVVQGRVDLVHEVEGEFFDLLASEDEGERGEGLLPSRQQVDSLPGFVDRPDRKLHSLEGVHGVKEVQLSFAARQFGVDPVELEIDVVEVGDEDAESFVPQLNQNLFLFAELCLYLGQILQQNFVFLFLLLIFHKYFKAELVVIANGQTFVLSALVFVFVVFEGIAHLQFF